MSTRRSELYSIVYSNVQWLTYFLRQRGGQGNVHLDQASLKEKEAKEKDAKKKVAHRGLADKLKDKLFGHK